MVSLIAAMSRSSTHYNTLERGVHGVIGERGLLPWKIKEDMDHFKKVTYDKPVVMGRKTYESIGEPLEGRINIIVSKTLKIDEDTCFTVRSLYDALEEAGQYKREIMVIGGQSIYEQVLDLNIPLRMYLTIIDKDIKGDTVFPYYVPDEWEVEDYKIVRAGRPNNFDMYFYKVRRDIDEPVRSAGLFF